MRMNSIKSVVVLVGLSALMATTAFTVKAHASASFGVGPVGSLTVKASGFTIVSMTGFTQSNPCTATGPGLYTLPSLSTDQGKAMLSVLNAALLSGKSVTVVGTGTCTSDGGAGLTYENISQITLNQ